MKIASKNIPENFFLWKLKSVLRLDNLYQNKTTSNHTRCIIMKQTEMTKITFVTCPLFAIIIWRMDVASSIKIYLISFVYFYLIIILSYPIFCTIIHRLIIRNFFILKTDELKLVLFWSSRLWSISLNTPWEFFNFYCLEKRNGTLINNRPQLHYFYQNVFQ